VTRRIVRRTAAAVAAGGVAAALCLVPALPALAHGAPVRPLSRTAACAPDNAAAGTAACRAARKANGGPFGTFDNLRVAGVNGKDKQVIPDGKLCSGNLPAFAGLDLPRADWPATTVTAGGALTVQYRTTIPHQGSFRIYLTKPGYDPTKPLGWDDLGTQPILTANNPPVVDGSYRMSGKLPAGRTGRHLLYTVWQNTSTPDTYYSCSDVVFKAAAAVTAPKPATGKAPAKPLASRSTQPNAAPAAGAPAANQSGLTPAGDTSQATLGRQLVTAALIVIVGGCGAMAFLRIRRARAAKGFHRRPEIR